MSDKKPKPAKAAKPAPAPAAPARPAPGTVKQRVERMLVWIFQENERCDHACKVPLDQVAAGTGLPLPLVEKISKHLEHHGLLEYHQGTVELTVSGMMEAEKTAAAAANVAAIV